MLSEKKILNKKFLILLIVILVCTIVIAAEKTKIVRSCGELCLDLIFRFYGIQVAADDIYKDIKPDQSGVSSLRDISECVKKYGLDCIGFKGKPEELFEIKSPVILCVKKEKSDKIGHFAVSLFDAKNNKLMGYDPSMSGIPFELTRPILDRYWTGNGLMVLPQEVKAGFSFNLLIMQTTVSFLGVLSAIGMNKLLLKQRKIKI